MPNMAKIYQLRVMESSGCSIMGRIRHPNGQYITRNSTTSVTVSYRSVIPTGPWTGPTSLTLTSVVFDELQTDARWTADDIGYNFRWDASDTVFTRPDGRYLVVFLFTPTTGAPYKVKCRVHAQGD